MTFIRTGSAGPPVPYSLGPKQGRMPYVKEVPHWSGPQFPDRQLRI